MSSNQVSQLSQFVGRVGRLAPSSFGGSDSRRIDVDVIVIDVRVNYGHVTLLVSPVSGSGECWVRETKIDWDAAA